LQPPTETKYTGTCQLQGGHNLPIIHIKNRAYFFLTLNFGSKNEKKLSKISLNEIKQFINEGHFAAGSMLPKIQAVVSFLEKGGKQAIITHPNQLKEALTGKVGTHIFSKRKI